MVYRAYRIPYEYVPQLEIPKQYPVVPENNSEFRIAHKTTAVSYDRAEQDKARPFPEQNLNDAVDLASINARIASEDGDDAEDIPYNTMELKNY